MRPRELLAAVALAMAPASASYAQSAMIVGAPQANVLRAGTEVPMRTRVDLTTKGKALRVGQRIDLEVTEPVLLAGQEVIPAGTPAIAELTSVRNKGAWGKSGSIEARVLYLRVGDRQIRCSGVFNDKGVTGTAGVVAAVAFVPLAGFLTTGTSAHIPMGAPIKAFLDEDVQVQFAATAQAPAPLIAGPSPAVAANPPASAPIAKPPVILTAAAANKS